MSLLTKSTYLAARKSVYVPASSIHLSSILRHESVAEKAKGVADNVNKKVGQTLSNVIEGAQNATDAASHKTQDLKNQTSDAVDSVNKEAGKNLSKGIDMAENASNAASEKLKKSTAQTVENIKNEKTIVDSVKDGVKKVSNIYEKTKEAVGLGQTGNRYDEAKDEAKKATDYDETTKGKSKKD